MGPRIIAPLCGPSVFASMVYLAELTHAGAPSSGNGTRSFEGSTVPVANVSYASAIRRHSGQQPKLNLPGEEVEGGGWSGSLHSFTEATSNFGCAGDAD